MHFDLKPISVESIPEALGKVERYRLLNEPGLAESICLDILTIAPDHQPAAIALLLARTEQFGRGVAPEAAREVLSRIQGDYERAEAVRPAGNDDAILRWNTCVRIIMRNREVRPLPHEEFQPILSE